MSKKIRVLVGEKISIEPVAIGCAETKMVRTVFAKFMDGLIGNNRKNVLTFTSTNFPKLMENINKNYIEIEKLNLPKNIQFHNGWRDSQTDKKKIATRVEPLSKENFEKIKKLISYYFAVQVNA